MRIRFDHKLLKDLRNIKKKDSKLYEQIDKKLNLFGVNPKHQSLRIHKLSGKLNNLWSLSINKSIRMAYLLLDEEEAYFVDIGTHDQVYRPK